MVKYQMVQEKKNDVAEIRLQRSDGDIDILVNDIMVGWFDENGTLCLAGLDDDDVEELERVGIEIDGSYIKTRES